MVLEVLPYQLTVCKVQDINGHCRESAFTICGTHLQRSRSMRELIPPVKLKHLLFHRLMKWEKQFNQGGTVMELIIPNKKGNRYDKRRKQICTLRRSYG